MAATGIAKLLILSTRIGWSILHQPFLLAFVCGLTAVVANILAVIDVAQVFVRAATVTNARHIGLHGLCLKAPGTRTSLCLMRRT